MFDKAFAQPKLATSQEHFSKVPSAEIPRSTFDRSHGHKTAFDAGYLVPFYVDEALPGDTFSLNATTFARMSTPIAPLMDNLYADTFFFSVPVRLLWTNWGKFNGAQTNPGDSTSFTIPQVVAPAAGGHAVGSLFDYMGVPTGVASLSHSALWSRAYNLIYNEWFRDQNLQNSLTVDTGNGPDTVTNYVIKKRGKRHDYFTSCLPWPQKGDAIEIPIGGTAPVLGIGTTQTTYPDPGLTIYESDGTTSVYANARNANSLTYIEGTAATGAYPNVRVDLSQATAQTINQLREAFQLQKILERDARGGTRYTEIVKSHFGVSSSDARLQRPEYLGGGSTPINISPVPQTSPTSGSNAQGDLAGVATFSHSGVGFNKSFEEHCVLIGLVSVRADLSYQQGLNRMWSRSTRYDFYWPSLAHLGEQPVYKREIYCDNSGTDDDVFGYQERYAEYRYKPSLITGKLRSTAAGTLELWHLGQHYSSVPSLNAAFIEEDPDMARVLAVTTEPHFIFDSAIRLKCARPMPVYSVPGLIDHL